MAEPFYRTDAREKVTGYATYGVDLSAPRMLHGGLVRARVPAGRLRSVDVSGAEALPGVVVVTAEDFPVERYGMVIRDQPPLARDRIRFSGEPVAAIAAPDEATLMAAIGAVKVDIETTPFVSDPESALEEGSLLVHEELESYDANFPVDRRGNVCGRSVIESGDVEAAFASAAKVVEERYVTPRVHQGYIEPRSCLVTARPDGGYEVQTSTQNPFGVRATLAGILSVPESLVHVKGATIGGGFGGKLDVTLEHFASMLSRKSGRPVKFVSSRAEELVGAFPRENSVVRIRSALDEDGRIIGRDVTCLLDSGAYAHDTPFLTSVASLQGAGPYRLENVRCEAIGVYTNTQPTGAYRGPTGPQMVLAVESHMDELASQLGEDRIAFRRRHLFEEGDRTPNGQHVRSVSIEECLDRALEAIGYDEPRTPGRGIGVACAWWTTTGGPTAAAVRVESDGTLSVTTGATEIGSGAVAVGVNHLVAEAFGVTPDKVRLTSTCDTDVSPFDFGAQGSRTTFNVGRAVQSACDDARGQLLAEASELLEAAVDDLEVADGEVRVAGAPGRALTIGEVAAAAMGRSGPVHATARFMAPPTEHDPSCTGPDHFYPAFNSPSFHCHAVEVSVDEATGRVTLERYAVAQDVGKVLVAPSIEGQIQGGVLQGIGMTLFEQQALVDGHVQQTDLERYKLPTAADMPPLQITLVEKPSEVGPNGAKGVGEPPIIVPAAAIVNAVADATGVRMRELPLTMDRVLDQLG